MKLLGKGAEANLYLDGDRLVKQRVSKKYRIRELDARLRKSRTTHEAKLLEKLKDVINVPRLYSVDLKEFKIVMEYVEGTLVKDFFQSAGAEDVRRVSVMVGESLGRLHSSNLMHNDLTTSNMILNGERLYFIDLGLGYHSTRLEDRAMDLVVLKKSLKATHPKQFDVIWSGIIEGYGGRKEVFTRVDTIEKRVRYAQ